MKTLEESFLEQCNEWLNPLGFYKQYTFDSKDRYSLCYTCEESAASITCFYSITEEEKWCEVADAVSYKLDLSLKSSRLAFKHPDISKWTEAINHYSLIAEKYPSF